MTYGLNTRSYNRSAEKRENDRQRKAATDAYLAGEKREYVIGPICTCRSFTHAHELSRHDELQSDHDWRLPSERRGRYFKETLK